MLICHVCMLTMALAMVYYAHSSREFMEDLFNKNSYNRRVIPKDLNITSQLYVSALGPVSDKHNTFEINYFHRQWWKDPRIAYNESHGAITLSSDISEYIWVPDITFVNARAIHTIHHASRSIIEPSGDIYVVKRFQATATCMLDMSNYPFDLQVCPLQLESFAYPIDELDNHWNENVAVMLNKNVGKPLAGYDLVSTKSYRKIQAYLVGNKSVPFPNLYVEFRIQRALMYYIFQSFIPILLLMMLNFGSYWVPDTAIPARVTLIVTTFLASTLILQTATEMTVKLSHLTPMQIFLVVSVTFIVISLMQYLTVLSLKTMEKIKTGHFRRPSSPRDTLSNGNLKQLNQKMAYFAVENDNTESAFRSQVDKQILHHRSLNDLYREKYLLLQSSKYVEVTHPLDRVCRFIIPSLYLVFVVSYWIFYKHYKASQT